MPCRAKSSARCRNCSSLTWSAMKIKMHATVASTEEEVLHQNLLRLARALLLEQGIYKLLGIEGQQIPHLLSHANKSHRQAQFTRDGNHHAALCCSIELG